MDVRAVGVEEEFLLVDPDTGAPRAVAGTMLRHAPELTGELAAEQVETATDPCADLADLLGELRAKRALAADAARAVGAAAVPLATSPVPVEPHVAEDARYRAMVDRFGLTAAEQLTCACHVHVTVESDDEAVAVVDRIRPWLPPLLALSVNSPFWAGAESGYAGYRTQVWGRWPTAGVTEPFGSAAEYHRCVENLLATDTILDEGMVYFDARVSRRHPTVEVRVADVCREPQDAVLLAALVRGLVDTAAREWRAGVPVPPVRTEVLRLAMWRASRTGLDGDLLDPWTDRPAPAAAVVLGLVDRIAPALLDAGDLPTVLDLWRELADRRPGAHHQRRAFVRGGVREIVADVLAP
jgi:carboxylate-amine ligase